MIHTTRTNDTIFSYQYKHFEIKPINVAGIITGPCCGFYDVNIKRNYHEEIRKWIFKNDLKPDNSIIEETNSILREFNYSNKMEYSTLSDSIPIVNSLYGQKFRFNAQLEGDYFYLYAYDCSSGASIKSFVESRIAKGLNDAHHSIQDDFLCSNSGGTGPNVLLLIGIDKHWKYEALPVGIVIIDHIAPIISAKGYTSDNPWDKLSRTYGNIDNNVSLSWPRYITIENQNIQVNIPDIPTNISSSVSVYYGNFEGKDFGGYNIPFYVYIYGDVKTITIGAHRLDAKSIKNGECLRLHIKTLHIGDNSLPLTAVDSRGNKSSSSLSIPVVPIRNNSSYHDDYDDLENRISDLESRMDDWG